ncbi:glycogen debranching protein GlgX [Rhabdothermincola salaria]|uniref:glycogen debranching protein GlgX n=1 Tax=Rhabdothermincola salaria TaxID=2903142 RepID=UPI001E4A747E|nr:glycogen debranching protein GlgX [Rhabdothermincola salaria]MCD9623515.1 glycogen debranching protein GlgX [Rhabdothermincola salaria]
MSGPEIWPGEAFPLGATFDGAGANFSLFSEVAERVWLCLFDDDGAETCLELPEITAFVHHGYVPGIQPGQRYGFRVDAPWAPEQGTRGNVDKLLIDPYAKAVEGGVRWAEAVFPYAFADGPDGPPTTSDSGPFVPKSIVISPYFDWADDRHPRTPWHETVVYETHVKGLTMNHPDVPEDQRGTYLGLCSQPVIEHLRHLGVTAVELLPVHQFVHDYRLDQLGLRNYWGYNSIAFLAPHNEYAVYGQRGQQVQEFKQMVKTLHRAGIEVILDVVYNHTAEGNDGGPMLSLKGADNAAYYRLDPNDQRRYVDYTGTGNSMNMRHPHVLQLIMDSLRYWVTEMRVDGFRFDLAATLARELHDVDKLSAFFDLIQQDPVVSQVKLIAEPWDVGEGGYQVGNFPPLWSEWNGKYRDEIRDFWRGADHTVAELGYRLTGSSDLYQDNGRTPSASINFVTAHDGFTLTDLVSYECKHNDANGEANRDGTDDNRSWNGGVEGPTDDEAVNAVRRRQRRNMLTTLLLSQGVPMLLGGDEIGRTQHGNNNAYCQDDELSWYDWSAVDEDLLEFTSRLINLRHTHRVFRRRKFFQGQPIMDEHIDDIGWFTPAGTPMSTSDWQTGTNLCVGVFLNGEALPGRGPRGERLTDASFFAVFNAWDDTVEFRLPDETYGPVWTTVLDTAHDDPNLAFPRKGEHRFIARAPVSVIARSVVLLRRLSDRPRG